MKKPGKEEKGIQGSVPTDFFGPGNSSECYTSLTDICILEKFK